MKTKEAKAKTDFEKTSLRFPKALWDAVRHRAIDEGRTSQNVVVSALEAYLKTPIKREGSR